MKIKHLFNNRPNDQLPESFSKKDVFYRYSIVFILAFVLILGSAFVLWYANQETNKINKATAISDAQNFSSSVSQFRNFYANTIVPAAAKHGMELTHAYKDREGALPLPATFAKDFGNSLSTKDSNFRVKLYSDKPFPWRNDNLDAFEKEAMKKLRKDPTKPIWSFETMNGEPVLRYARSDVLKASCVGCHNTYPGTPKTDWKVGQLRGVLEVIRPMSGFDVDSFIVLKRSFFMMVVLILSMVLLMFFILRKLSASIKIAYESVLASQQVNKKLTNEIKVNKKISHNLKASDSKMRAMMNSVQEVIIVIDQLGIISECNNSVKAIFGYKPEEILGKNISQLMTGTHSSKHDAYIQQYIAGNVGSVMGQNREFFAVRKNGEKFPIELFVTDARVDNDIIFTGTIRDITHRKKTEQMAAAAHQAALDSSKLKSEFLANMSHEIRTPMNGVIGMTELLLLSKLNDEQQELALTVKESAGSLLTIINDILDFSKIEAGKLTIKRRMFHLLDLIEASINLLEKEATRKHIEIVFFIDKNVPRHVSNDAGRLRQVLINLLNNALKFTDQGHVILNVSLADKQHLRFSIIDSGPGISKKDQKTLFDSFSQVDGSSSREHGGTGLGLAISQQLVSLMGGKIGVKSERNAGSTFWFSIEIEELKKLPAPYINAPVNVLMFNSSYLLNCYYKKQMESWGMTASIVSTQNHFIDKLKVESYQLLAIDIDGIYIETDEYSNIKILINKINTETEAVIVLYANRLQINKLKGKELGANVHLINKPIKHTVIKQLLNTILASKEQQQNPDKTPTVKVIEKPTIEDVDTFTLDTYHVLLAEDNRVNQMVATSILEKFSCKVTLAVNGLEAVEYIKKEAFDAVFMDCQMPKMDGYEASREIRKLPASEHNRDIPIIAFTANAMVDEEAKCKEAGMDDYLSKPIDINELKKVLEKWRETMDKRKQLLKAKKEDKREKAET